MKKAIIGLELVIIYWFLFGGGELNSPSYGIKAMIYVAEHIK
jgi:hypothetical protein